MSADNKEVTPIEEALYNISSQIKDLVGAQMSAVAAAALADDEGISQATFDKIYELFTTHGYDTTVLDNASCTEGRYWSRSTE